MEVLVAKWFWLGYHEVVCWAKGSIKAQIFQKICWILSLVLVEEAGQREGECDEEAESVKLENGRVGGVHLQQGGQLWKFIS